MTHPVELAITLAVLIDRHPEAAAQIQKHLPVSRLLACLDLDASPAPVFVLPTAAEQRRRFND